MSRFNCKRPRTVIQLFEESCELELYNNKNEVLRVSLQSLSPIICKGSLETFLKIRSTHHHLLRGILRVHSLDLNLKTKNASCAPSLIAWDLRLHIVNIGLCTVLLVQRTATRGHDKDTATHQASLLYRLNWAWYNWSSDVLILLTTLFKISSHFCARKSSLISVQTKDFLF